MRCLSLAGVAAHSVVRPAAPLTTFIAGFAAGLASGSGQAPDAASMQAAMDVARSVAKAYCGRLRQRQTPARGCRQFRRGAPAVGQQREHRAHDRSPPDGRAPPATCPHAEEPTQPAMNRSLRTPVRRRTQAPAVPAPSGHLAHTWEEARQAAFDCAAPIPAGWCPCRNALGRTLAADITALQDMPHYASVRHGRLGRQRHRSLDPGRARATARAAPGQPHRHRRTHSARRQGCAAQRERRDFQGRRRPAGPGARRRRPARRTEERPAHPQSGRGGRCR